MSKKIRVGIVFGGRSGEHEVSLASARSVMRALDPARYDITPIGITHDGRWLTAGDPMARLASGDASTMTGADNSSGRELVPGATGARVPALDVIFPVLHGPYGEDGTVQGLLELADLPYVGCGVLAGALAMDKIAAKHVYLAAGLPVAAFVALTRRAWETTPETALAHIEATLGYPVFVKPANLGSSIGIGKAANRAGLTAALDEAAALRPPLIDRGRRAARARDRMQRAGQ